jgi:endonuclease/exonuclease/phosphatase family metal-dependent hydrolase
MKLLQLNVWGGRLEKQIFGLINQEKPDIICLQEAISIGGGSNGGWFLTVDEIKRDFDMNLAYAPVINFSFMRRKAEFGNAILSSMPFQSTDTLFTRFEYKENFDYDSDDYNVRNLLHVTLKDGDEKLHVLTHHGHHVHSHKNGDAESLRQCAQIVDYIKKLSGKIVLTGDFNLSPHSESLEIINSHLTNLAIKADLRTTRTQLTHKKEVCDYIFINDKVKVESFKALDDVVSDHKALMMTFA